MVEIKIPLLEKNIGLYTRLIESITPESFLVKEARRKIGLPKEEEEKQEERKVGFIEINKRSWTTLSSEELKEILQKLEEMITDLENRIKRGAVPNREEAEFRLSEMKERKKNLEEQLKVREEFTALVKKLAGLPYEERAMHITQWARERKRAKLFQKEWRRHTYDYTYNNAKKILYKYLGFDPKEKALTF